MALVLPSSMQNMLRDIPDSHRKFSFRDPDEEIRLFVDMLIGDMGIIDDLAKTIEIF
jgi:hypothetical protein